MYLIKTSLEHFPFDPNQLNVNSKLKPNTPNPSISSFHDSHHNYHHHNQQLQNSLMNSMKLEDENDLSNLLGNYDWENSFRTSV